jgi:hypothetical protein
VPLDARELVTEDGRDGEGNGDERGEDEDSSRRRRDARRRSIRNVRRAGLVDQTSLDANR